MAILERGRRARSDEQKRTRLDSILDVAWRLFQERPYDEITMALVAEQTQLAKGTLYLYVNSKEALFLAVLDRQLGLWFDAIDAEAGAVGGAWTTEQAVDLLCGSLIERPALVQLLGIAHSVLEPSADVVAIRGFKEMLVARLVVTGGLLEAHMPSLASEQGAQLLLRLYAFVIGLQQLAAPPRELAELLEKPEMQPLAVDFASELRATIGVLLRGLAHVDVQ